MLFKALEDGSTILINNVSTEKLNEDSMLLDILQCRRAIYKSKTIVKTFVSGNTLYSDSNLAYSGIFKVVASYQGLFRVDSIQGWPNFRGLD